MRHKTQNQVLKSQRDRLYLVHVRLTNCAIPFSGAKTTCCQTRNCLALLLAAFSLVMLPQDKEPAVQGWLMLSGVHRFNFHPFSEVLCLIGQSVGVWWPGARLVNCFVQSCALCFLRRGRGGGGGRMYFIFICRRSPAEVGGWDARTCTSKLLYSFVQSMLLWASNSKEYCGNSSKKLCIPSSYAVVLVLDMNDT